MDYFTEHPEQNGMTYFEHLLFSGKLSYLFFTHSIKALLHAVFPFTYKTSSTELAFYLQHHLLEK